MKKFVNLSFAIVLVQGLLLVNASKNTEAAIAISHPMISDGVWNTGITCPHKAFAQIAAEDVFQIPYGRSDSPLI